MIFVMPTLLGFKRKWTLLAQISVWMTSVVINFQAVPARRSPAVESEAWVSAAQFVLVVVLGLIIAIIGKWNKNRDVWLWSSAILLIFALVLFFAGMLATQLWTCSFDGRGPMVIGETLSHAGDSYFRENPSATCTTALQDAAGDNMAIWNREEIATRHALLVLLFLATILTFSLAAVLMLESLRASRSETN
jgi:hypothetical protein